MRCSCPILSSICQHLHWLCMNSSLQRNHQTFPPQWRSCVCCISAAIVTLSHFLPRALVWCDPPPPRPLCSRGQEAEECSGLGANTVHMSAHVCTCLHMSAALIRIWKALGGCIWYSGVQILDRTMTDHYVSCWLNLSRVQQSSGYYDGARRVELSPPSCSRPSPPLTFYHQQWEKNVIITQFCWFVSKGWDVCSNFFGYDDCYNSVSNVGLLVRLFNARISFLQLGRQDKTSLETSHITIHDTFVSEAPWCC